MRHLYIPDPQAQPGRPDDHAEWLGNYVLDQRPDVIVLAGDLYDMPSCSRHKSPLQAEGASVRADLNAGHSWLRRFDAPIRKWNTKRPKHRRYRPRKIVTIGNHEAQIYRITENDPRFRGEYGDGSFEFKKYGWETYPFLEVVEIDGIHYSHYFANQLSGRPIGGSADYKLSKLKFSFTMGHVQDLQIARQHLQNGQVLCGLVAGSFYPWNEGYKGPQGNHHWRGVVVKNEVHDGQYDLMTVSLSYLRDNWS